MREHAHAYLRDDAKRSGKKKGSMASFVNYKRSVSFLSGEVLLSVIMLLLQRAL